MDSKILSILTFTYRNDQLRIQVETCSLNIIINLRDLKKLKDWDCIIEYLKLIKYILQWRFTSICKNEIIGKVYLNFVEYFNCLSNEESQSHSSDDDYLDEYYYNDPIFPEYIEDNPIKKSIESLKHQYIYNKLDKLNEKEEESEHLNNSIFTALISIFHVIYDLRNESVVESLYEINKSNSKSHYEQNQTDLININKNEESKISNVNFNSEKLNESHQALNVDK